MDQDRKSLPSHSWSDRVSDNISQGEFIKELTIPKTALNDPNATEILRVWIANQQQHVSVITGIGDNPFAWGMMLSDLARHVANAYQQQDGLDFQETLTRIKSGFEAEMESPTDTPSGEIIDE